MEALFIVLILFVGISFVGSLILYAPVITLCFVGIIFALLFLYGITHIDNPLRIGDCLVGFIFLIISIGCFLGAYKMNKICESIVPTTQEIKMNISKLDLDTTDSYNIRYFAAVTDGQNSFIIRIDEEEYVTLKEGDDVVVIIKERYNSWLKQEFDKTVTYSLKTEE